MNADECILLAILDDDANPGKVSVFDVDANADVETRELRLFVSVAKADGLSDRMMVD